MIKVIRTKSSQLPDIPIAKDTLVFTVDTKEVYYDLNNEHRMQIKTGIQYRDEDRIFGIPNPNEHRIFISIKTGKLYRFFDKKFIEIKERSQLVDLLLPVTEIKPVVLNEDGTNIAPKTLASQIIMEDGRTLKDILSDKYDETYTYIYTKSNTLEAEYDHQKVFNIPFPIPGYDLERFPIEVLFGDKEYVKPSNYSISKNQLIFTDEFTKRILKGNLITLIFHYTKTVSKQGGIDADRINGRFVIYSENEPMDMKVGDIWYDLTDRIALERTENGWKDILNPDAVDSFTSNIIVSAQDMEIPINIEGFDTSKDALEVFRNGLLFTNGVDYEVNEDGKSIKLLQPNVFYVVNEMHTFTFKVLKNGLPRKIGVSLVE